MKVLVTGHLGFIGKHVSEMFSTLGHEVYGVDRKDGDDIRFLPFTSYPVSHPDLIIHLAAVADISENWRSTENRDGVWSTNVDGTMRLLETFPTTPMIFASSCAVYGPAVGAAEDKAPNPRSPYAASKVSGEALIQAWAEKYGTAHHILRLPCVVGAGYAHGHISDFVRMMTLQDKVVARTNGWEKRTHIHVADAVMATVQCANGAIDPGTYNVGAGPWSCRDTARIMKLRDEEIEWPLRSAGWTPTHGIEEGVRDALKGMGWKR